MRTTISPGPATGFGSSSMRAGSAKSWTTAARIVSTARASSVVSSSRKVFISGSSRVGARHVPRVSSRGAGAGIGRGADPGAVFYRTARGRLAPPSHSRAESPLNLR